MFFFTIPLIFSSIAIECGIVQQHQQQQVEQLQNGNCNGQQQQQQQMNDSKKRKKCKDKTKHRAIKTWDIKYGYKYGAKKRLISQTGLSKRLPKSLLKYQLKI
jgi:hypothetical protein